jgi:hypothetical protein
LAPRAFSTFGALKRFGAIHRVPRFDYSIPATLPWRLISMIAEGIRDFDFDF